MLIPLERVAVRNNDSSINVEETTSLLFELTLSVFKEKQSRLNIIRNIANLAFDRYDFLTKDQLSYYIRSELIYPIEKFKYIKDLVDNYIMENTGPDSSFLFGLDKCSGRVKLFMRR